MTLKKHPAYMTYQNDDVNGKAYYLAPVDRTPPPYKQIQTTAFLDVAEDGTFAGVELVVGDLPPANGKITAGKPSDQTSIFIEYVNYRGERNIREIIPQYIYFGSHAEYHPNPQWLMVAYDVAKKAERHFAMADIRDFNAPVARY